MIVKAICRPPYCKLIVRGCPKSGRISIKLLWNDPLPDRTRGADPRQAKERTAPGRAPVTDRRFL